MVSDKIKLFGKVVVFFLPYAIKLIYQRIRALYHRWTYKSTSNARNVVVLGGSFAGVELAKRLSETLPTGYKVVMIEKNSHFNYSFAFPRFSVISGYEHLAFIPYQGIAKHAPDGIFEHIRDTVDSVTSTQIHLASGTNIDYEYLAIATGSSQPLPARVSSTDREKACSELRSVQESIRNANKIAILGGGAVGVELASDIKDFYLDKDVALFHSRGQLLNSFGKRLHDYVLPVLQKLKIRVVLNQRPQMSGGIIGNENILVFSDGREEAFDLVIPCTGQRPNSSFMTSLAPDAISKDTSRILVRPNLQVCLDDNPTTQIFAFGDVAEHGGPKMARAGFFQADIVLENILAMIHKKNPSKVYIPRLDFEGAILLTLGKTHWVAYSMNNDGSDLMVTGNDGKIDLRIERAWKQLGADFKSGHALEDIVEEEVKNP